LNLEVPPRAADPWEPLLGITGEHEPFAQRCAHADEASVVDFLAFDRSNRGGRNFPACLDHRVASAFES